MQNHPPLDFSESQRTYEEACRYIVAGTTQAKMPDLYIEGEYPIHTGTPAHRHTGTPAGRATDLEFLVSQEADAIVKEEGIEVLSYAPLQALWRSTN